MAVVVVVVGTQQSPGHRGSVATVTSAVQYWSAGVLECWSAGLGRYLLIHI